MMDAARHLPCDDRLPHLAHAVDGGAMRRSFEAALRPHGIAAVSACQVDRIRYRPGHSCTVSYRLQVTDERSGCSFGQRLAGRFCAPGQAAGRHARNRARVVLPSGCGVGSLLLPELELFAWLLPNDPKLAALPALMRVVAEGGRPLAEAVVEMAGGPSGALTCAATLNRYVPESRACARFDVALGDGRRLRLFAKIERDAAGATSHRLLRSLYDSPASREGRLHTPRPLLWQAATGLNWQAAVAGVPLSECDAESARAVSAGIGELLAALHATPLDLSHQPAEHLLAQPRAGAELLARVEPAWTKGLAWQMRRLEDGAAAVRSQPLATLHGDLHPNNILLDGERLGLIDLDGARPGPAVLDLGAWIADALLRAQLAGKALEPVQQGAAAMLAGYAAASRRPIDAGLLAWATARSLLHLTGRGIANLRRGRFERTPELLTLTSNILARRDVLAPLQP